MNIRTRRVAVYGLLIALAFVFGYIERILPIYLGAPGVKLGLANLVTILSLYVLGLWPAVWISLARIFLSGFAFGGMSSILFSLAGAALSLLVMWICRRFSLFGYGGSEHTGRRISQYRPVFDGGLCGQNLWRVFLSSRAAVCRNRCRGSHRAFRRSGVKTDRECDKKSVI